MNMNRNPTVDELRKLIAACDDSAGHHLPWVGFDGEVHITLLPTEASPNDYDKMQAGSMKFRLEAFCWGNDYVGPAAAADTRHVKRLFDRLVQLWTADAKGMWRAEDDA